MSIEINRIPPSSDLEALVSTCAICREEMEEGSNLSGHLVSANEVDNIEASRDPLNLGVAHYFHRFCLNTWRSRRSNCPTCRTPLTNRVAAIPEVEIAPEQEERADCIKWNACCCCTVIGGLAMVALGAYIAYIIPVSGNNS